MAKNTDLTVGSIPRRLCLFTLPLLISVICQQIYNLADSIIAGKFLGETAFAAVSNSYEVTMIFLAISVGVNIGVSVILSQCFGAKRYAELKSAVSTTFLSAGVLSLLVTGAGILATPAILSLIHTPDSIFAPCATYLTIYIGGFTFMFFYNIATGVFSSLGDSLTPLIFLICSSVGNIFLDILFVTVFGMQVEGVAWATFLTQGIACLAALAVLWHRLRVMQTGPYPRFSRAILAKIAVVSIPSIFQQSVISIGNIAIQRLVNSFGTAVIAGFGAAVKLNGFVVNTFTTTGNGVSAFTAQNVGGLCYDRVKGGFRVGQLLGLCVALPSAVLYLIFAPSLIAFFMDSPTDEAVQTGALFLRIVAPFFCVISGKLVSDGVLRGAGAMKHFLIATFADLIVRVVLSFLLSPHLGPTGIWITWPFGWLVGAGLSLLFYFTGKWKQNILSKV